MEQFHSKPSSFGQHNPKVTININFESLSLSLSLSLSAHTQLFGCNLKGMNIVSLHLSALSFQIFC